MGNRKPQIRISALSRCLALSLAVTAASLAPLTDAHAQSQQPATDTVEFDIPTSELAAALDRFAEQSGLQVVSDQPLRGVRAPALRGRYAPEEALRRLLQGSGFGYERLNAQTLVLKKQSAAAPPEPRTKAPAATSSMNSEPEEVQELEKMTVTGTRIRGAPPASPVLVIGREEMLDAGHADLGEVARTIPQNFGGGQNPSIASGQAGQENLNNSSTLNLRGFGPDATLTLINGHRVAYDAFNQGVDISAIPVAAIERFEVVADGASALYGSDAVGGVANIILRRDFEGIEASARFGASTDGGNERQQYSVVTGTRWDSGGFMAAFDYSKFEEITAGDRSYTSGLHESQYLLPGQEQHSAVLAGHQRISDTIRLELDAYFNDRRSEIANASTATTDVFTNGLFNKPSVRSYAVTPTLRFELPGQWEGSISGTHAESKTEIRSRRFVNSAQTTGHLIYDNKTNAFEANAEGPVFRASGGDARLAVGAGYRSAELDILTTTTPPSGVTVTTRDFTDSRDTYYGYGELAVPLVSAENRKTLVERLDFNVAFRYESYRDVGDVTTPKLGLIYAPHPDVTLRLSWGESFKAATLNQDNTILEATLLPGFIFAPPAPGGAPVLYMSGGSANPLEPERAETWAATIGWRPQFVDGLSLEVSYFDIRYRNRVANPIGGAALFTSLGNPIYNNFIILTPSAQQVLAAISGAPLGLSNQSGQIFDPDNVGAIVGDMLQNTASETARGVDFLANYTVDTNAGNLLRFTASASYLKGDRQVAEGLPEIEHAGLIFTPPHWRARAGATWQRSNLTLSGFANYVGSTLDNRFQPFERVSSFTTFDAVARIKSTATDGFFQGFETGISVLNLLDEKPDRIRTAGPTARPYDSLNHSVVGRFVSVTFAKHFF